MEWKGNGMLPESSLFIPLIIRLICVSSSSFNGKDTRGSFTAEATGGVDLVFLLQ